MWGTATLGLLSAGGPTEANFTARESFYYNAVRGAVRGRDSGRGEASHAL